MIAVWTPLCQEVPEHKSVGGVARVELERAEEGALRDTQVA